MSEFANRILLVEDEFESQIMIDLLLSQYPCQVDVASDGLLALHKACTLPYDCILMDLGLPRLDGMQAFITIQKIFKVHSLTMPPVIALTEYVNYKVIEQCFELGMASVLFKPLKEHHIRQLFARIKQLEERKKGIHKAAKIDSCFKPGLSLSKPVLSAYGNDWNPNFQNPSTSQQIPLFGSTLHEDQAPYQVDDTL